MSIFYLLLKTEAQISYTSNRQMPITPPKPEIKKTKKTASIPHPGLMEKSSFLSSTSQTKQDFFPGGGGAGKGARNRALVPAA